MTKKLTDAEKERRRRERAKQREITPCRTKVTKADIAKVQRWASESASKGAIARRLGMDHKTFRVLMEQNPELRAAYDEGVEAEHQMLVSALKRQLDKSPVPAIFLLKTRHGYREGDQSEQGNRVSVTFNLPGAQPLEAFRRGTVIEHNASGGGNERDDADA
ncbi:hypothetical protein [Pseudoxanthomonas mexicana]